MTEQDAIKLIKSAHEHASPKDSDARERIDIAAKLSDLGIESIAAMEMAAFLEAELDADFPDDELANVGSVSDLVKLIQDAGSARGA